jgi:hypothetical protein
MKLTFFNVLFSPASHHFVHLRFKFILNILLIRAIYAMSEMKVELNVRRKPGNQIALAW